MQNAKYSDRGKNIFPSFLLQSGGGTECHERRNPFISGFFARSCAEVYILRLYQSRSEDRSIMDGLNTSIVKRLYVTLPPIEEQHRIVDYLDARCSRIDSIIQKKQELLANLDTYKKSLIYEYVTGKKEVPAV